ncbi:efflux RND transporter permease subunit [Acidicapsa acidisoli]|uniref:efflux RND transporter permease subunit n=1 Tax=Acidicapsa acidisoli TaxID=1615681 RepID=UPI0021DF483A|nr:efflux RND transporter permease subunit [Acidicapsa acidisoli]
MWIVRFALQRPYTFVIVAVLIAIFGVSAILTTPTDILPDIDIPIVSVIWSYSGMDADDMSKRIVGVFERALPTSVNNIQYTESQSYSGVGVVKVHFQPGVQVDLAIAQVTALAQSIVHLMPSGIMPPYVLKYDASSVPIVQVSLGGKGLSQIDLYDLGQNFIRGQLATIKGAAVPLPYGGEQRSIMVDVEPTQLAANHLTASELSAAMNNQNLVTPSGTEKIGDREYTVGTNSSPGTIAELNDLPIRNVNGAVVQMKDVAWVHNGYQPQTSYVSENGQASALLTVIKSGASSTLTIVDQVKAALPRIKAGLPPALTLTPIFDQSVIVKASIRDVVQEAITAAFLTAMMMLVFLGSWRSTLIVSASIPLAALFAIEASSALGETISVMSLGGLALAVGMLVDDATVEIENTHRNLGIGKKKPLARAILDSAEQVAMPALISTMSICIVFVPVTLLSGSAKYIFTPLAVNVVLAMIASYGLSRTLVPTMMHFLLPKEVPLYQGQEKESPLSRSFIWLFHKSFDHGFDRFAEKYKGGLEWALEHRTTTLVAFAVVVLGSLALVPLIGQDFFPYVDSGQMEFHVRPPAGTRIETATEVFKRVNEEIRRVIPAEQLQMVVNNIGLPPGGINLTYSANDSTSNGDGDVMVLLAAKHRPTQEWMQILRHDFSEKFPEDTFFFEPADITNQTLNFGLPAPIDVQVRGKDAASTARIAVMLQEQIKDVPGAVDVFMQQQVNAPKLNIAVNRLKAQELALTARDVSDNVLLSLSGSGQVAPNFWLDPKTGVEYPVIVQVPQRRLHNLDSLEQTVVTAPPPGTSDQLLRNVSTMERQVSPLTVSHYNALPIMDVFANVQQRDLGGVASDVQKIVEKNSQHLPPGVEIVLSGQVQTMNTSFANLEVGIAAAVVFVYLLMAINFQSWTVPFIILMALPGAFAGIVWMLFLTQTTFNVPSLMGALMTIGVATANSILVVSFANESRGEGESSKDSKHAALIAGSTRLRPVCMTALAMIIGMLPMALSLGEGGEQNAPIGRAVIGGLLFATVGTLFMVPVMYSLMSKQAPVNWEKRLEDEIQGAHQ